MRPARLGRILGHILARLGLPVVRISLAVIHLARHIHPHQPRPAARSSRLRRRRRGRSRLLRRRSGRNRRTSGCRRTNRRSTLRLGGRSGHRRNRSRVPRLHSFMPATSPALRSRRRVRPIPANPSRARRSACWHLRHPACRHQQPSHHPSHHQHLLRHCRNPSEVVQFVKLQPRHPSPIRNPCHGQFRRSPCNPPPAFPYRYHESE